MKHATALFVTPCLTLLVVLAGLPGCESDGPPPTHQDVTIDGQTFSLELALNDETRFQGLSDRESIPDDGGMLFVFQDASPRSFVMRRCLVPIDIVFLDSDGRIVAMHAMAVEPYDTPDYQLERYSSRYDCQFVIELQGGMLETLSIQTGDEVALPLDQLKSWAE